ncbi:MAG TPA: CAP domain-containing protein [Candidatus Acidoferrum sp.]
MNALAAAPRALALRWVRCNISSQVALIALLLSLPSATLAQEPSDAEQLFFDSANRERVALHLHPLKWDAALAEAARRHAQLMAKHEVFQHQLPGELPLDERAAQAGARFSQIGENIAIGAQAPAIHTGWMHSPGHRANILDVHFTALGVGVVEDDEGELYAVEDFSVAVASLGIDAQEEKVAAMLSARGLQLTGDKMLARQLCAEERAPAGRMSMLIVYFEVPDVSRVPEQLEQRIRDGKFQRAAVGACQPRESGTAVARYRIAVLLFPAVAAKRK